MPSREQVESLISFVDQRCEVEALRTFYAPHAQTYENSAAPTVGLPALIEKEERFLSTVATMVSQAASYIVDGDRVAINWIFEYTSANGQRFRFDEIAYQLWEGDLIVQEHYYYDPSSVRVSTS